MKPSPKPGRLVLVISTLTHGGAEVQVKSLASALAARGWRTDLVVLRTPEAFVEEIRHAGVTLHSLGVRGAASGAAAFARLVRLLRDIEPDVVHSHMRGANLLTRITRPFARPPVLVCTAHNFDENVSRWRFAPSAELSYRLTDRLCDLTTNVSRAAVARYVATRATPASRIRFVPNGIDVECFRRDPSTRARLRAELGIGERPAVLAVGRFQPQKNHDLLVRAFARCHRRHPDAVLLLAGSGPLERAVRATVAELGIEPAVKFMGVRDDVPALLSAADIYAMSSRYEGLPIVLLEAAAAELPTLATDVGGNAEIVANEASGLLVPSEDLDAFSAALDRLLAMPVATRASWGRAGRERVVGNYALDHVVDEWEAIYRSLLGRTRTVRGEHAS